jgi:cobalt-zinc-cadmium resistance protein CzcA
MFDQIIAYSVRNKLVVGLFVLGLIVWGVYSLQQIPIDAVPDITNNQVQVITSSPTLATQEVERFITTPIELALQNLQDVVEIRSISFFGLSVVTVVFEEDTDIYLARQLVGEHLREAEDAIPSELGTPEMAPISTGLGEIYQYVVVAEEGYEDEYGPMELRSIQDWIVSRQLSGIEGVVEINTMGGYLKRYEVAVDPDQLKSVGVTISDLFAVLQGNNQNTGGAYIEKNPLVYYIRTDGILEDLEDIRKLVVDVRGGVPILIEDVAEVGYGTAPRYGALIRNGEEAVGGRVMMLRGANSAAVTERVRERVEQIQASLPEGVRIEPYLVRDKLVRTAIGTVRTNLIEGGLIVVFVLVLLLGNWRASLIVASVIPLAMLFAISMMNVLGISANLMSLGAIDFGLIVDGAVIIVESIVHRLHTRFAGRELSAAEMDAEVTRSAIQIRSSAAFGEIIILMVYLPILALVGIEGKMFRPMAQTVMLAITGALILSLTYVPMMAALVLNKRVVSKRTLADRIMDFLYGLYAPVLRLALRLKVVFVVATVALFAVSIWVFSRMGGEFIPTLEEGDLAMQQILPPGTSLSQSVDVAARIQDKLLADIPEIQDIVTNVGSAEIPTDPMPVEVGDVTIVMAPRDEWTTADSREGMFAAIEESLDIFPGVGLEFSQPIQLRFNELMTGVKADIAVKLYGEDPDVLLDRARAAEGIIGGLDGVGSATVEQTAGMPQVVVDYDADRMAQYGLSVRQLNLIVEAAFAGARAGTIYEGDRRYALTVRLQEGDRTDINSVAGLFVPLPGGGQVPLREVADVRLREAPMRISRDNTNRYIVIGVNVGDTDVETLVDNIQTALADELTLPAGYYITYGGQFENLQAASARLAVAVPLALALIFILLYFTFGSFSQAALIFVAIPLSAIGGIWALELRGMPFSISAGIGFIALFGVAVLNGIVLIGYFNQLKAEGVTDIRERIIRGTRVRLRPVIMTAAVASLGFLPMAISSSGGAEVQRPLATVVIGGLVSATFLTLVVLPILYSWLERLSPSPASSKMTGLVLLLLVPLGGGAQVQRVSLEEALELAIQNNPDVRAADRLSEQSRSLLDLPYAPGRTDLSYNGDGQFRPNGQRQSQFTVIQSFPHPANTRAGNRLQESVVAADLLRGELTRAELRREVRQTYYTLQYEEALLRLHTRLIERYADYVRIAELRVGVGEASPLEVLNLRASLQQQQRAREQAGIAVGNLGRQLAVLLQLDRPVSATDTLGRIDPPLSIDTLTTGLSVDLARRLAEQRLADIEVARAGLRPDFRLGYSAQYFDEGGYLNGLEAGVSLPLFNRPARRRIEALTIGAEAARERVTGERQRYERQVVEVLGDLQQLDVALDYYRRLLDELNPEIIRVTRLRYRAGEVSYLEVLGALQLLADNETAYLGTLVEYNRAVARLNYLRNE